MTILSPFSNEDQTPRIVTAGKYCKGNITAWALRYSLTLLSLKVYFVRLDDNVVIICATVKSISTQVRVIVLYWYGNSSQETLNSPRSWREFMRRNIRNLLWQVLLWTLWDVFVRMFGRAFPSVRLPLGFELGNTRVVCDLTILISTG